MAGQAFVPDTDQCLCHPDSAADTRRKPGRCGTEAGDMPVEFFRLQPDLFPRARLSGRGRGAFGKQRSQGGRFVDQRPRVVCRLAGRGLGAVGYDRLDRAEVRRYRPHRQTSQISRPFGIRAELERLVVVDDRAPGTWHGQALGRRRRGDDKRKRHSGRPSRKHAEQKANWAFGLDQGRSHHCTLRRAGPVDPQICRHRRRLPGVPARLAQADGTPRPTVRKAARLTAGLLASASTPCGRLPGLPVASGRRLAVTVAGAAAAWWPRHHRPRSLSILV